MATIASPIYWGLDPLFSAHIKLLIRDVDHLLAVKDFTNVYLYHDHIIYKVEIMGDVVSVVKKNKLDEIVLDDGTGRISCTLWKDRDKIRDCKLGDLVTIMGRVTEGYRDSGKRIVVQRLVNDTLRPNIEYKRWKDIIQLHQRVYTCNASITLPLGKKQSCQQWTDTQRDTLIQDVIRKQLQTTGNHSFLYQEMLAHTIQTCQTPNNPAQDIQASFDKVLKIMVLHGELLMKDFDGNCFQLINPSGDLAQLILEIMQEKTTVELQQLCYLLRSTLTYAHLRKDTVIKALTYLEEQSFIYSPQSNVYKYIFGKAK
ncbi:CST complex subunit STN1 [Trichoplax sp. H2]|uniref:CST complex subunit STN1 n=1 Tax=Trichoplax adhaerens TaxID=10228 RepID=B3S8C5_TRIAD|nr:hypothetical protein TRIADDRAFT_60488 [Trichoplax adhaerens]EDV21174.1 hypothetical protein TRIADDRAFT_60488 [Trichoplax adhaerens]RDD36090.1 CST complex subunit STN1 [Trichoplax sp. H2]|eukprot:XP_002116504.1 hypothetical protein TRIADDRAFT_60488 [Trichoplax adhaerens]